MPPPPINERSNLHLLSSTNIIWDNIAIFLFFGWSDFFFKPLFWHFLWFCLDCFSPNYVNNICINLFSMLNITFLTAFKPFFCNYTFWKYLAQKELVLYYLILVDYIFRYVEICEKTSETLTNLLLFNANRMQIKGIFKDKRTLTCKKTVFLFA